MEMLQNFSLFIFLINIILISFKVTQCMADSNKTKTLLEKFQQSDYKLQFERVDVVRYNKQYVKKLQIVTFKYNRTAAVINLTLSYSINLNKELELVMQAYKFASNEYRLFPIRFQMNFCAAINSNIAGTQDLQKCGNFKGCPIRKNEETVVCNWSPDQSRFPPYLPSGQYMIELQGYYRSTELHFSRFYATVFRPFV